MSQPDPTGPIQITRADEPAGTPEREQAAVITDKMILDCISEGVFTIDGECRIQSFNKAAETITGFSVEQVRGQPCIPAQPLLLTPGHASDTMQLVA